MRDRRDVALVALALLLPMALTGCAARQPGVLGRRVTINTLDAGGPATRGELLTVDQGEVVVRARDAVQRLPLAAVRNVQVERHTLGYKTGLIWAAFGGLATGGALWMSCSTQPGNDCRGVGAAVFGAWMIVGGLAGLSMESTTHFHIARPKAEELRPYARFPQGLPAGLDLDSLLPPSLRRPNPEPH